jgi:hypothetical protein
LHVTESNSHMQLGTNGVIPSLTVLAKPAAYPVSLRTMFRQTVMLFCSSVQSPASSSKAVYRGGGGSVLTEPLLSAVDLAVHGGLHVQVPVPSRATASCRRNPRLPAVR